MSCPAGIWAIGPSWPPARHPPIDELGVARQANIGAEPKPLHHPRPEPLDQGVGPVDQAQRGIDPSLVLQIDGDVAAAARQQVEAVLLAGGAADPAVVMPDVTRAIDPDHLGAHVREQHRAKRPPGPMPASSITLIPASGPMRFNPEHFGRT